MKRRDFLRDSTGLIGALIPVISNSESRPCPPPAISIVGGQVGTSSCEAAALPAWVPAPGTFADISLNLPSAVDPCAAKNCVYSGTQGQSAVFAVWTSGIFAPELGPLGSYVCWGGGHKAYAGNEVYRFDLATRVWSRLGNPSPYSDSPSNINSAGAYPDGTAAPPHSYQTLGIRPSTAGGGAAGSLIQATLPAVDNNGYGRDDAWWQFDFSTSNWSQFVKTAAISSGTLTAKLMVQEPSGNCWWLAGGYVEQIVRVTLSGAITSYAVSSNITGSAGACGGVIPGSRVMAIWGEQEGVKRLRLLDLSAIEAGYTGSSASKYVTPSGPGPDAGSGLQWCPDLNRFAAKLSTSSPAIYWLSPNNIADPWNSPWQWSVETLAGVDGARPQTIYDGSYYNGSYNRFVWCPPIKSFIWATGRSNPVQVFRPVGS